LARSHLFSWAADAEIADPGLDLEFDLGGFRASNEDFREVQACKSLWFCA
jgi:hypothetical protein